MAFARILNLTGLGEAGIIPTLDLSAACSFPEVPMMYPIQRTPTPTADPAAARVRCVCQKLRGPLFVVASITSTR